MRENLNNLKNRLPFILLLSSSIVVFAAFILLGRLRLELRDDSFRYISVAKHFPPKIVFSGNRTFGYPLLIKGTLLFSKDLGLLPLVQFALHVGAVCLFYCGLRSFGYHPWMASFAAVPLLTLTLFRTHVGQVMADLPATSLSIATVGLLFIAVKKPSRWPVWILLMIAAALAYQVRPTMLYLVGFVPLFGSFLLFAIQGRSFRENLKPVILLVVISVAPLLLFDILRYRYVQETGLSSFDGYSLAGIALHMLDDREAERLPAHLAGVAKKMLEKKSTIPRTRYKSDYEQMVNEYNLNLWLVAIPVLIEEYGKREFVKHNTVLREMSHAILWNNKLRYLIYAALSLKEGVRKSFGFPEKYFWGGLYIVSYLLYLLISRKKKDGLQADPPPGSFGPLRLLAVLAVANYCFGILPFLFYHPPILRYIASIDMYFVSLLGASSMVFLLKLHGRV